MANDTLQSFQKVEIVDLLCEGPIEGISGGNKGIYLDETPVRDENLQYNFDGIVTQERTGTQDQAYIQQSNSIGSQRATALNLELIEGTPRIRTINNATTDRVRCTFTLPSLYYQQDDGAMVGNSVEIEIFIQYQGDSNYTSVKKVTVTGKSSSVYQRSSMISLSGQFPVNIKIIRNTASNVGNSRNQNSIRWTGITEITDEKLTYPNSALCHLKFDSKNFTGGIPKRRYLVKGLKIKIPTGVTVDSNTGRIIYPNNYIWDGTFQSTLQWCADPSWSLWNLITNSRYGANIPETSLDRWDFLNVSKYCNEMVPNGKGGEEPRFSLNLYLHSRQEIFDVINDLTSVFRGLSYYSSGILTLTQDKRRESQYILSPSNVIDGVFNYSGTSQKARHTTATIAWQDYDLLGEVQFEYVEDVEGISKYGIINKQSKAIGCYSQGQAHRFGEWLLLSEQLLTETVSFGVAIDSGIVLIPGMVISIADPTKTGIRRGGRISSVTSKSVFEVDSDTNISSIDSENNPKCTVLLPSGLVETRDCTINGKTITLSEQLSETPQAQSSWVIDTDGTETRKFRIISVGQKDKTTFGVTALMYNESIYETVDRDQLITIPNTTNLTAIPSQVTNIAGEEYLYEEGQNVKLRFTLSWSYPLEEVVDGKVSIPIPAQEYKIKYQLNTDNWVTTSTSSPSIEILDLAAGTLKVEIQAVNYLGFGGRVVTETFTLEGKQRVPEDVTNLRFENEPGTGLGRLSWDETTSLDVKVGGRVFIRHTSVTGANAIWSNSTDLIRAIPGRSTEALIPKLTGTVFVKFVDDGNRFSTNPASVAIVTDGQKAQTLLVKNQREDTLSTPFSGTKTNTEYNSTSDVLKLELDSDGKVKSSGSYDFASVLDLGGSFSLDIEKYVFGGGSFLSDLMDSWPSVDARESWDGGDIDKVNSWIDIYTTNDDPTSSPTWSSPVTLTKGTFTGRAFKFKAHLTSSDVQQNMHIENLGYIARFEQRTEQSIAKVDSGAGAKTVQFSKAFWTGTADLGGSTTAYLPSVTIAVYGLATGDFVDMGTVTGTQFSFTIKNSSGAAIDKQFTWVAVGYGRAV